MEVSFSPKFIKNLEALPKGFQDEVIEKIEVFKDERNHVVMLKVHKLHGRLKEQYSFSVNYRLRIIFVFLPGKKREAYLVAMGDHDIYN